MTKRITRRSLFALFAVFLAGCSAGLHRSLTPLPEETLNQMAAKGLRLGASLYVRIFKQESVLEAWLRQPGDRYVLFRTYKICNYSGVIGPKLKEGDRQSPEGFYLVSAKQMNPNSSYYLSFNMGYPNAYDKSFGRTGSLLMVHGGCKSVGCYAITNEAVKELYALAREAFKEGQKAFAVHAFPFRMTPQNMALNKDHQWVKYWWNLKEGYDLFEASHIPPVAGVKDGRYVFFEENSETLAAFRVSAANGGPAAGEMISAWQK